MINPWLQFIFCKALGRMDTPHVLTYAKIHFKKSKTQNTSAKIQLLRVKDKRIILPKCISKSHNDTTRGQRDSIMLPANETLSGNYGIIMPRYTKYETSKSTIIIWKYLSSPPICHNDMRATRPVPIIIVLRSGGLKATVACIIV